MEISDKKTKDVVTLLQKNRMGIENSINDLKRIGRDYGFGSSNNGKRADAYKFILRISKSEFPSWQSSEVDSTKLSEQEELDVKRAFVLGDTFFYKDDKLDEAREQVKIMLSRVFHCENMYDITYTQGLLNVFCIFYILWENTEEAYYMSMKFIRDFYGIYLLDGTIDETNFSSNFLKGILKKLNLDL
ncbi:hypothetical protein MHBO_004260, partial [Bonamia ostreae]